MTPIEPEGAPDNQSGPGPLVTLSAAPETQCDAVELTESARLLACLGDNFSMEELRVIVIALEIDWDELAGSTKSGKAAGLIEYLQRREQLAELDAFIRHFRPDLSVGTIKSGTMLSA